MTGSGIQGIGLRALMTFQRALEVTSHNIANVTTPGYHRQEALLSSALGRTVGRGYIGGGVQLDAVRRNYDAVLAGQLALTSSTYEHQRALAELSAGIDSLLGPGGLGLDEAMNDFFASLDGLATDPTSPAARGGVIAAARGLADRFRIVDGQLDDQRNNLNARITGLTTEVNTIAASIAELNEQLGSMGDGPPPNDLLDQRANLLTRLSELVDVTAYEDQEGFLNISVANGQGLVLGTQHSSLVTTESEFDPRELGLAIQAGTGGAPVDVTRSITGGALGGALQFRRDVLDPVQNRLGQIAAVLVDQFNAQHQRGVDLQGNAGLDFFTPLSPELRPSDNNSNLAADQTRVVFDDTSALTGSDYLLEFDGAAWSLTEISSGAQVPLTAFGPDLVAAGLRITPDGAASAGDSYEIRPTRAVARSIGVAITDTARLAASDPDAGPGAVGDAGNALALVQLQELAAVGRDELTFNGAYQTLVTSVGTDAAQFSASADIYAGVLADVRGRIDAAAGVNLDEEALNLQRFQQAYQAAAEVVAVADSVFETLLSATRR